MKLLSRLAPHQRLSRNPLFNLEVRRIRWGVSQQALFRYSLWRLAIIGGVLLVIWFFSAIPYLSREGSGDLLLVLMALSLLASFPLDLTFMSAAIGSINGDISANRWELLRLTPLSGQQVIAAKHGVAQVRAWRWMILVIALRLGMVLIGGATALFLLLRPNTWSYMLPSQTISTIISLFFLAVVGAIYTIEPFWRMRSVTALGVAISARTRQQTSSVLAALGSVFALWLLQGIILFALVLTGGSLFSWLALMEAAALQVVICSPALLVVLVALTVYGFYAVVQSWSLRRAERWIARTE
jgi:hypothetical protein